MTDDPTLAPDPNNPVEKWGSIIASGLGGALPSIALGGPAVTMLLSGAGGALGGEAGHEVAPDSTLAPLVGGLAGGIAGGGALPSLLSGKSLESVASDLGDSTSLQQAGKVLQSQAKDWMDSELPARQQAIWDQVDKAIPSGTQVPLTQFTQTLGDLSRRAGYMQPVVDALGPALPKKLLDALNNKTPVGIGIAPDWDDVQTLRTAVRDAAGKASGVTKTQLNGLYDSLTGDMRAQADRLGAGSIFDSADAQAGALDATKGVIAKTLAGKPEDAASQALGAAKRGGSDLGVLRFELPGATDELAAAHLRTNAQGWKNLSPEAKEALVPNPVHRATIGAAVASKVPSIHAGDTSRLMLESIAGGFPGNAVGRFGAGALGLDPEAGANLGEILGASLPLLARGVKAVGQNPGLLGAPVQGAVSASGNPFLP